MKNTPNETASDTYLISRSYSSCIASFNSYHHAEKALQALLTEGVDNTNISLLGLDKQQGSIGRNGLDDLEDEFTLAGVPKAQFHCYQCLIHSGLYLMIVTGEYTVIEQTCELLEQMGKVDDVSIHFNA